EEVADRRGTATDEPAPAAVRQARARLSRRSRFVPTLSGCPSRWSRLLCQSDFCVLDHAARRPAPVHGRSPTFLRNAPCGRPTGGGTPLAPCTVDRDGRRCSLGTSPTVSKGDKP